MTIWVQPAAAGLSARLVYLRSGTAETCPDQAALKAAVAKRLGYDPFLLAAPHMIVAEISGEGAALHARARLLDDSGVVLGSRELSGKSNDCAELLASLALAISLTLDPLVVATDAPTEAVTATDQPTQESANSPQKKAAIVPPMAAELPPAEPAPPPRAPAETPTSLTFRAGLLGGFGWLPSATYAPSLGIMLRGARLSLGLDGAAMASQTANASGGLKAEVSLTYAALWPCFWGGNLAVCALGDLGRYSGTGGGVTSPRWGAHLHVATGVRLVGSLPLPARWSFDLVADGLRNWVRPEFLVDGQRVYQPAAWAGNIGIFVTRRLF